MTENKFDRNPTQTVWQVLYILGHSLSGKRSISSSGLIKTDDDETNFVIFGETKKTVSYIFHMYRGPKEKLLLIVSGYKHPWKFLRES